MKDARSGKLDPKIARQYETGFQVAVRIRTHKRRPPDHKRKLTRSFKLYAYTPGSATFVAPEVLLNTLGIEWTDLLRHLCKAGVGRYDVTRKIMKRASSKPSGDLPP